MEIVFVTGNEHKFKEFVDFLDGFNIVHKNIDTLEIQGTSEEIIRFKAKKAFKQFGKPCVVEDTSFGFEAWNWLPGPYCKDFNKIIGCENYHKVLKGLSDRAKAFCTIGFAESEQEIHIFQGEILGRVVEARKDNGFDFDRVFVPNCEKRAFSEMSVVEKNKISHRARALEKLRDFLEKEK